ncbi:hypothetical protein PHLCEN_2v2135 [Hermanssonia centrifuga]|uniref:F-box domain-containing protein n=1 Tax=Hermanssonia centrifuga TaxID=98765 RepID=A0A2R6RPZ5_9APHY|nr:hypothetical protein PHLCEN_2v2135 [Hermanssonia centrifuga]
MVEKFSQSFWFSNVFELRLLCTAFYRVLANPSTPQSVMLAVNNGDGFDPRSLVKPSLIRLPPEVLFKIVGGLSTSGLLALMRTSKRCRLFARMEMMEYIYKKLSGSIPNVMEFLDTMRRYEVVISGSFVLNIIDRGAYWNPSDIDMYVPYDAWYPFILAMEEIHNSVAVAPDTESAMPEYLFAARSIDKVLRVVIGSVSFDFVRSASGCATTPIASFLTTLVMNYISADGLCIAYPSTLKNTGVLTRTSLTDGENVAVTKYLGRGYDIFESQSVLYASQPSLAHSASLCGETERTFVDKYCIIMPFGLNKLEDGPISHTNTVWRLGGYGCDGEHEDFAETRVWEISGAV